MDGSEPSKVLNNGRVKGFVNILISNQQQNLHKRCRIQLIKAVDVKKAEQEILLDAGINAVKCTLTVKVDTKMLAKKSLREES
uniref:Uncharacterized protein n=1 Tax=Onchocerca volvulus TaxID=6282 RepID=A0A2K6VGE2_ONCVO